METTTYSPFTLCCRSSSPRWDFSTITGWFSIPRKLFSSRTAISSLTDWHFLCRLPCLDWHFIWPESVILHKQNIILSPVQVPVLCVRGRHLLLLCGDDLCGGRHLGTLQQNHAALLHPPGGQLPLLPAAAVPHNPVSQTPAPQVHCWLRPLNTSCF